MFDLDLLLNVLRPIFSAAFLASILRVTTPILFPSLGALVSDRAGVINIGLEGIMLVSAFTGVVFSAKGGIWAEEWLGLTISTVWLPWVGLVMGLITSVLMALLLAVFHLRFKANLILSGIALNFLGAAGTVALMYELTGDRGNTKGNLASLKMPFIQLPDFLLDIPVLSFFLKIFDNQSVMTWLAFISVALVWYLMYRTPVGMHLRAVGENPDAAASVGIRVQRVQYLALFLSGLLAGLGGIHMSMGYLTFFQANMTAGRGFIALATPALGGGHPVGTGLASLVFGFFDALSTRIGSLEIPSQLPQMMPYVATVMALVIYALQSQLTSRVRTLRSAEGETFDARYWKAIQRLSVLHMFMAMIAVIGIIIGISMYSSPDGFQGVRTAYPAATGVALGSLLLILINLPFITHVERIGHRVLFSALVAIFSLWVYLGIFFGLYVFTYSRSAAVPLGVLFGLLAAVALWLWLGGRYLAIYSQQQGHGYWGDVSMIRRDGHERPEMVHRSPLALGYTVLLGLVAAAFTVLLVLGLFKVSESLVYASPTVFLIAALSALIAIGLWRRTVWGWQLAFTIHAALFLGGVGVVLYLLGKDQVEAQAWIWAVAGLLQIVVLIWLWGGRKRLVAAS